MPCRVRPFIWHYSCNHTLVLVSSLFFINKPVDYFGFTRYSLTLQAVYAYLLAVSCTSQIHRHSCCRKSCHVRSSVMALQRDALAACFHVHACSMKLLSAFIVSRLRNLGARMLDPEITSLRTNYTTYTYLLHNPMTRFSAHAYIS